jgi:hypothetical protein
MIAGFQYQCPFEVLLVCVALEMCKGKMSEFFNRPRFNAPEDVKRNYKQAMIDFANPSGDHLSILKIMHNFTEQPEQTRFEWCNHHSLKANVLNKILRAFESSKGSIINMLKETADQFQMEYKFADNMATRVLSALAFGYINHMATVKNNEYAVYHCKELFNLSDDSLMRVHNQSHKTVIYHELFSANNNRRINIVSVIN